MAQFKKTTMVRYYGDKRLFVFEDRIEPTNFDYVYDAEYMVVFRQEPKTNSFGHAFYCQRVLEFDLDCNCVGTLSQKQRKLINDGIQE
eukprot:1062978-Karenia_brevis.AAC.1